MPLIRINQEFDSKIRFSRQHQDHHSVTFLWHNFQMDVRNILFLCTGNSCRSQMAEGFGKLYSGNKFECRSAGLEAHGKNPRAIAVMQEVKIDISTQDSTELTPQMLDWADLVITVCGHADDRCPTFPRTISKIHWPLEDPAKAAGSEKDVMRVFRKIRDEIHHRTKTLFESLNSPMK